MIHKTIMAIFQILGYGGIGTIGATAGYHLSNKSYIGGMLGIGAGALIYKYGTNILGRLLDKLMTRDYDKLPKHEFVTIIEKINEYKKNTKNEEDKQKLNKILQKIQNYVNNDNEFYDASFKNYVNSKISGF